MKYRNFELKIIELFFENNFSVIEIKNYLENSASGVYKKYADTDVIKKVISKEIKRREKKDYLPKELRELEKKIEKYIIKQKLKKEFMQLYRKVGFLESHKNFF